MVQGRVTLCNAKYPTAFSAGAYSRSTCVEKRHKLCHAKCYLRTKEREPCLKTCMGLMAIDVALTMIVIRAAVYCVGRPSNDCNGTGHGPITSFRLPQS